MTIEEGSDPSGLVALARTPPRPAALAATARRNGDGAMH